MPEISTLSAEQFEQVQELAYTRFMARGYEDGHDLEDWLIAEQQVLRGSLEESTQPQDRNMSEIAESLVIEQLPQRE